ncbi:unnamed protein product [Linum trigynum]|uniref:Reverse transcriptase zinc-binding domain-containing protein n=1 Tax=Linum trigynum TaxID=586398 RepID=A0AAV2F6P3_9ROSI
MYRSMCSEKFPGISNFPHKAVWRAQVPSKICYFLWLVYHNRILTQDNLMRRGWNIASRCTLCEADIETTNHLFRECRFNNSIWSSFMQVLKVFGPHADEMQNVIHSWPTEDPSAWLERFIHLFLHAFTWELWKERNGRMFNDEKHSWQSIFHKIGRTLLSWVVTEGLISEINRNEWPWLHSHTCPGDRDLTLSPGDRGSGTVGGGLIHSSALPLFFFLLLVVAHSFVLHALLFFLSCLYF